MPTGASDRVPTVDVHTVRSVDVGAHNIINTLQLRGRSYDDSTPVSHVILLERSSALRPGPNHDLVLDLTPYPELHTGAGFDAWGARLRHIGGVRLVTGRVRGHVR